MFNHSAYMDMPHAGAEMFEPILERPSHIFIREMNGALEAIIAKGFHQAGCDFGFSCNVVPMALANNSHARIELRRPRTQVAEIFPGASGILAKIVFDALRPKFTHGLQRHLAPQRTRIIEREIGIVDSNRQGRTAEARKFLVVA
jgi:hypothetical protein